MLIYSQRMDILGRKIIRGGHIGYKFKWLPSLKERSNGIEIYLSALAIFQERQEKEKEDGIAYTGYIYIIFFSSAM